MKKIYDDFNNVFTDDVQIPIANAVIKGYQTNYKLYRQTSIGKSPSVSNVKPHTNNSAIDMFLFMLPSNNSIIKTSICENKTKNYKFIELRVGNYILTHNHLNSKYDKPRESVYRKNYEKLNRQRKLFRFDKNIDKYVPDLQTNDDDEYNVIYAQLCHGGYGPKPDFIFIGIPENTTHEWIFPPLYLPTEIVERSDTEQIEDNAIPEMQDMEWMEKDVK